MTDTTVYPEAFEQALVNHQYDQAEELLTYININEKAADGNNYIMRACISNDLENLKWLWNHGADPNVHDNLDKNLFFLAINSNSEEAVKWLASEHADYLQTFHKGETPLHAAVLNNNIEMVKALVQSGAHFDTQNGAGKTALDVAHDKQYKNIVKWLLLHKSFKILEEHTFEQGKVSRLKTYFDKYGYQDLNERSEEKNFTIAEYAASTNQIDILRWLKSKNIPVDESLLVNDPSKPMETYNMLLVGETGVGKSTFINAFMNYLNFDTLEEAEKADSIHSLIPSYFNVTDADFKPRLIKFGSDSNESVVPGASATQSARSYVFEAGHVKVRLIDTPGIGDTRGINKDEENFDRMLNVIGELKDIHGICILLKPNNAKLTVLFEYCIKQLLSRLQKDAARNIIFLFTNSRSTFYRPGDTITPLKVILDQMKSKPPYIDIPFSKKNVFCLDNEAFRFLVAERENVEFDVDEKENFSKSWSKSTRVSIELLKCLKTLTPHKIQETVSLNEARRLILRLSVPLAQISENIQDNIDQIDRYKQNLSDINKSIDDLKKYLMVPIIGLTVNHLTYPQTVCTNANCTEAYRIEGTKSINYKQVCHDHCYLDAQREVIGDPTLMHCTAMMYSDSTYKCRHKACGHLYKEHMHIYYTTTPYNYTVEDENVSQNISKKKVDIQDIEKKINDLTNQRQAYQDEKDAIQKSMAKFAHFLKNNAITPFNDTYKKYIQYLIEREKKLDNGGEKKRIDDYEKLIVTYENYKQALETQLSQVQQSDPNSKGVVTAGEIMALVKVLYGLPLSGKTIKDFYEAQKNVVGEEIFKNTEKTVRLKPTSGSTGWFCNKWYALFC